MDRVSRNLLHRRDLEVTVFAMIIISTSLEGTPGKEAFTSMISVSSALDKTNGYRQVNKFKAKHRLHEQITAF
jgi:hypothetical protein